MGFPQKIADAALAACERHCCICHKFCGTKIELHHIKQRAYGGEDSFENCIPLCFDCHADMGKADPKHNKGKRYTEAELKMHRDNWYRKVKSNNTISQNLDKINQKLEVISESVSNVSHTVKYEFPNEAGGTTVIIDNGDAPECLPQGITINEKKQVYQDLSRSGHFTFDYSNNNGEFIIGEGIYQFVTRWSKASNKAIHAYKDGRGIECIARIKAPMELSTGITIECDFSSRVRTPEIGDVIIWKNQNGKYAATKVLSIKDDSRGDECDELTCEYLIWHTPFLQNGG